MCACLCICVFVCVCVCVCLCLYCVCAHVHMCLQNCVSGVLYFINLLATNEVLFTYSVQWDVRHQWHWVMVTVYYVTDEFTGQ